MHKYLFAPLFAAAGFLLAFSGPAMADHSGETVKITGLGSHVGDFCNRDRGLLLEDPNGTVILYDAGRTGLDHALLQGGQIGENIDVVLLSSAHGDHLGNQKINIANPGPCNDANRITITPNANTTDIAAAKDSHVFVGGEMSSYLGGKLELMGESQARNTTDGHTHTLRQGGWSSQGGVKFAVIVALHSNGLSPAFLPDVSEGSLNDLLSNDSLTAYVGPDHGYIIEFTNGLVVYLTGDTGQTSDMKFIAGKDGFYGANLAVVNMGGVFSMGPVEAAWAVDHLIKPRSVILTHSNQKSTTGNGTNTLQPGSKMATFIAESHTQAHIPSTGKTMMFNGHGQCVGGFCQPNNR